jgi:hypothetical protein
VTEQSRAEHSGAGCEVAVAVPPSPSRIGQSIVTVDVPRIIRLAGSSMLDASVYSTVSSGMQDAVTVCSESIPCVSDLHSLYMLPSRQNAIVFLNAQLIK